MNSLRLKMIKGFRDTGQIELRPLTIVIGQNSTGKSAVVRFPLVLKQTFLDNSMAPLLFYGKSIDYGSYEDVVFGHDKQQSIGFEVSLNSSDVLRYRAPLILPPSLRSLWEDLGEELVISSTICRRNKLLSVQHFAIHSSKRKCHLTITRESETDSYIIDTELFKGILLKDVIFDKFLPNFRFSRAASSHGDEHKDSMDDRLEPFHYLLSAINRYFHGLAMDLVYIGPFRRNPKRFYRYTENAVDYVGSDGEFAPVILGQDCRIGKNLIGRVSSWLEKNLNFSLEVEDLKGDMFKIIVKDLDTGACNNIIDVGHGLSQLIPIVVQTFISQEHVPGWRNFRVPGRRVLHVIEQPELHLHPAAQSCLADLFVDAVRRKKRFLIETHSEHFLIRLRRYIVEGKINSGDVALYYTEKIADDHSLRIRRLDIDEFGQIGDWPKGFFSEDYRETLAYREALRRKNYGRNPGGDSPLW